MAVIKSAVLMVLLMSGVMVSCSSNAVDELKNRVASHTQSIIQLNTSLSKVNRIWMWFSKNSATKVAQSADRAAEGTTDSSDTVLKLERLVQDMKGNLIGNSSLQTEKIENISRVLTEQNVNFENLQQFITRTIATANRSIEGLRQELQAKQSEVQQLRALEDRVNSKLKQMDDWMQNNTRALSADAWADNIATGRSALSNVRAPHGELSERIEQHKLNTNTKFETLQGSIGQIWAKIETVDTSIANMQTQLSGLQRSIDQRLRGSLAALREEVLATATTNNSANDDADIQTTLNELRRNISDLQDTVNQKNIVRVRGDEILRENLANLANSGTRAHPNVGLPRGILGSSGPSDGYVLPGLTGPTGFPGSPGSTGFPGSPGPTGFPGSPGQSGLQGQPGSQGQPGWTGLIGQLPPGLQGSNREPERTGPRRSAGSVRLPGVSSQASGYGTEPHIADRLGRKR